MPAPLQPTWLIPSAQGQMSNKRGSNTGADALSLSLKYVNPRGVGDYAGTIHVTALRTLNGGQVINQPAWDGWAGLPSTNSLPPFFPSTPVNTMGFTFGGRQYIASTTGVFYITFISGALISGPNSRRPVVPPRTAFTMVSASLSGGTVGSWRYESDLIFYGDVALTTLTGLCVVEGGGVARVYAMNSNGYTTRALINADGTIGPCTTETTSLPVAAGQLIGGYNKNGAGNYQGFLVVVGGSPGSASTNVQNNGLNFNYASNDGALNSWANQAALPAARGRHAIYYSGTVSGNYIKVLGGDDNTTASTVVYNAGVGVQGAISAWGATDPVLPLARSAASAVVSSGYIFITGGSSTNADTGGTSTVYSATINAAGTIGAWTSRTALPVNLSRHTAFLTGGVGILQTPYIAVTGGRTAVPADMIVTYENQEQANGTLTGTWNSGVSLLTAGNLGTGGSVTNNQDGTQTITFSYGAFGTTPIVAGFTDGDQIQFTVTFNCSQTGDPAPPAVILLSIGQPPTISAVTWSDASGKPTLIFSYNPGGGGGPEAQWQVTVAAPGPTQIFDSGVRYDQGNSIVVNVAPYLLSGTIYTPTITIKSTDIVMTGSTNTATVSVPTTTPSYTAAAVPVTITAVPNNAQGSTLVSWVNSGGSTATFNRVYFRRNGTTPWYLLKDAITAVIGSGQNITAMDQLALNVAYDFTVSAIGPGPGESALGTAATNAKIDPVAGNYASMLHIAGNGVAYQVPLYIQSPTITSAYDTKEFTPFGSLNPVVRNGIFDYHILQFTGNLVKDAATLKSLQQVLQQAYLGNTLYYRDALGGMITCAIRATQKISYLAPTYRHADLEVIEVANLYSPSTTQGSALGFLQQANGSVVPLDVSEVML